jgi:predicted Zn-dependent protease
MKRLMAMLLALVPLGLLPAPARAANLPLIRDAEIEHIVRAYSAPVFAAAGIPADNIKVHIVNDPRINAFVAGGRHMFINTGLLMEAKDPSVVIGVIAHETGHIVNNHLIRLRAAIEEAQVRQIITFILAGAAAVAARDARAGAAVASLGQRITAGTLFHYSQGMESEADEFAFRTLDRLHITSKGLEKLLEGLSHQEALLSSMQDPYLRSHPLTPERLQEVRNHMGHSPYTNTPIPKRLMIMHARLRAKLRGFILPPEQVRSIYAGKEKTAEARYALAVAYHRDGRTDRALALIDSLIREAPRDPYYIELKGQILLESARIPQAVAAYRTAVKLAPNEPLIHAEYAHALLETHTQAHNREAVTNLIYATRRDSTFPLGWRLLGVAYGRLRDIGKASVALAEYYLLLGNKREVRLNIQRAERHLRRGSPAWRRIQDIKSTVGYAKRRRGLFDRRRRDPNDEDNRDRKTR